MLYLSCDWRTCWEEAAQISQNSAITLANGLPKTTIGVDVQLAKVLDLTDSRMRKALGIKKSDLTQTDWKMIQAQGNEAITQTIGRFARNAGFEALLVPSAVWNGKNLDIFMDRLQPTSNVVVVNIQNLT